MLGQPRNVRKLNVVTIEFHGVSKSPWIAENDSATLTHEKPESHDLRHDSLEDYRLQVLIWSSLPPATNFAIVGRIEKPLTKLRVKDIIHNIRTIEIRGDATIFQSIEDYTIEQET